MPRSELLAGMPWLAWGFTRRQPGVDAADGNVSYSGGRDRALAWARRAAWLGHDGLDAGDIVSTGQVHRTDVLRVSAADAGRGAAPDSPVAGIADAMVTDEAGPVLWSLHADCLPILLVDPARRAVGVAHAGWRGTVTDMAGSVVRAMTDHFGSDPADIVAYLGPSIGGDRYEVGPEVVEAWFALHGEAADAAWPGRDDRWQFDGAAANRARLIAAGLRPDHIEASGVCTFDRSSDWFSHRAQGPATGRFAAWVSIRRETQPAPETTR